MEQQRNKPGSPETESGEKRPSPRRRTLKKAVASYADQSISMDVLVRNISETGVKLKLMAPEPLPDHFTLYVELDGITVDCEAVWRDGNELGAQFISEIRRSEPLRVQKLQPTMTDRSVYLRKKLIT